MPTVALQAAIVADANGAPMTPTNIAHRGGPVNPTAAALVARFGAAVVRSEVTWGETTVFVTREALHGMVRWLHDEPSERYDYLVDVTAVEYRDADRPIEVVWHLRALAHRRFLRLKVELTKRATLSVPSIMDIYSGADWLERECYDMFGIRFEGHPDLRRLLIDVPKAIGQAAVVEPVAEVRRAFALEVRNKRETCSAGLGSERQRAQAAQRGVGVEQRHALQHQLPGLGGAHEVHGVLAESQGLV